MSDILSDEQIRAYQCASGASGKYSLCRHGLAANARIRELEAEVGTAWQRGYDSGRDVGIAKMRGVRESTVAALKRRKARYEKAEDVCRWRYSGRPGLWVRGCDGTQITGYPNLFSPACNGCGKQIEPASTDGNAEQDESSGEEEDRVGYPAGSTPGTGEMASPLLSSCCGCTDRRRVDGH